ncbi:hypothetical protein Cni_G21128 [Canna indica]|uniref:Uncharacterized protein n=1 Tax=Canna indica TaxID=4628 RepID=A0AAQ3KV79_9LILI|nr:hypothetical protein Cni_G21128 [Canna indica]
MKEMHTFFSLLFYSIFGALQHPLLVCLFRGAFFHSSGNRLSDWSRWDFGGGKRRGSARIRSVVKSALVANLLIRKRLACFSRGISFDKDCIFFFVSAVCNRLCLAFLQTV